MLTVACQIHSLPHANKRLPEPRILCGMSTGTCQLLTLLNELSHDPCRTSLSVLSVHVSLPDSRYRMFTRACQILTVLHAGFSHSIPTNVAIETFLLQITHSGCRGFKTWSEIQLYWLSSCSLLWLTAVWNKWYQRTFQRRTTPPASELWYELIFRLLRCIWGLWTSRHQNIDDAGGVAVCFPFFLCAFSYILFVLQAFFFHFCIFYFFLPFCLRTLLSFLFLPFCFSSYKLYLE